MAFLFDWEEKKRSTLKTGILISLTFFFLNGEGSLPLFGGVILCLAAFFIFYFIKNFNIQKILSVIKLTLVTGFFSLFLHAYWIVLYVNYVLTSYAREVEQAGGQNGVVGWVDYISTNTSLINLFRLQGFPEWYLNPFHPYSNVFLNNPLLVIIGFCIPVFAFLPLLLFKKGEIRKYVLFFSFLALFSLLFIKGSHAPFGFMYLLLIQYLPGFIAFRTPFYKFSPALWFAYAILISFTINFLFQKYQAKNKIVMFSLQFILCVMVILYSYPFLNGSFFDYWVGERSTRIQVPQYIFDFGKWSESPERISDKTLMLPPSSNSFRADVYTWGYWSLGPVTNLLTKAPIITINNGMSSNEVKLISSLYQLMKENNPAWIKMAKLIGIKSVVLRKDFVWQAKDTPTDNPLIYEKLLKDSNLKLVKKFGKWDVYDIANANNNIQIIHTANSISYLKGDVSDIGIMATLPSFNPNKPIYVASEENHNILPYIDDIFVKSACIHCSLQPDAIDLAGYTPLLTRGSHLYSLFKERKKYTKKPEYKEIPDNVNNYLYQSLSDLLALKKIIDEKKNQNIIALALSDYENSLINFHKSFTDYLTKTSSPNNNFLIDTETVRHTQESILLSTIKLISNKDSLNTFYQAYDVLQEVKKDINNNIWITPDEVHKRFIIDVPKNGMFTLLYKSNDPYIDTAENVTFSLDGNDFTTKPNKVNADWFSLGEFFLAKGIHKLEVQQTYKNLINAPQSTQITFSSQKPCFTTNKITVYKPDLFKVSFQYKLTPGSGNARIAFEILSDNATANALDLSGDELRNGNEYYSNDYQPLKSGSFYLSFCKFPDVDKEEVPTSIELKDMKTVSVNTPEIFLYTASSHVESYETINTQKISPTHYKAMLPQINKRIIVFNENYNKNWKLNGIKSSEIILNGYANGWFINDRVSVADIHYGPQDVVGIAFMVSLITFLMTILIYVIIKLRYYEN